MFLPLEIRRPSWGPPWVNWPVGITEGRFCFPLRSVFEVGGTAMDMIVADRLTFAHSGIFLMFGIHALVSTYLKIGLVPGGR